MRGAGPHSPDWAPAPLLMDHSQQQPSRSLLLLNRTDVFFWEDRVDTGFLLFPLRTISAWASARAQTWEDPEKVAEERKQTRWDPGPTVSAPGVHRFVRCLWYPGLSLKRPTPGNADWHRRNIQHKSWLSP